MREITADELVLINNDEMTISRTMWCEDCQAFTLHEVRYTGTVSAADEFIVGLARVCHRISGPKIRGRTQICGLQTHDYIEVWDFNALIENRYY